MCCVALHIRKTKVGSKGVARTPQHHRRNLEMTLSADWRQAYDV